MRAWGTYFTDVPLDLENVAHLSAGPGYYVAVTAEGRLRAWGGREGTAQMLLPVGLAGVKATSATTALLQDGSVSVWGSAADDLMPPQDLNDVVQISSSGVHTLALRKDGSVRGWGNPVLAGVQGLDGIVQISASTTHNLALTRDGSVLAFGGYDFYGEREVPEGLPRVKYVAAGTGYSLAVLIDGTVEAWGWNTTGQIGVPAGLKSVKQVAAGDRHAAALLEDGTVVSWGKTTDVPADIAAHDVALERHM